MENKDNKMTFKKSLEPLMWLVLILFVIGAIMKFIALV